MGAEQSVRPSPQKGEGPGPGVPSAAGDPTTLPHWHHPRPLSPLSCSPPLCPPFREPPGGSGPPSDSVSGSGRSRNKSTQSPCALCPSCLDAHVRTLVVSSFSSLLERSGPFESESQT